MPPLIAEGAGADAAGDGLGPVEVAGRDRTAEPVGGVVGDAHGIVVVVEADHHQHRAEDLLAGDGHGVVDVGEQRRLDEEALGKVRRARRRL